MNDKTKAAIIRHGESLLKAFPNATEKDPIALCKKLRRIETSLTKPLTDACNGDFKDAENGTRLDAICEKAKQRVFKLLGGQFSALFINRDPRSYALKMDDAWIRNWNNHSHACLGDSANRIYTDMGGFGILAPDLNQ